jgi:hypothetical protein
MADRKLIAAVQDIGKRGIQVIVVGGLAAVLNGAPVQTFDIDLVYFRDPANLERLLGFLDAVDAIFRMQPARRLRPNLSHLAGGGHLNLVTSYGPLDLLGSIGEGLDYAALLPLSSEMRIGEGLTMPVLNLETIIAVKQQLGSEKDLATLPILRRTLLEIKKANS